MRYRVLNVPLWLDEDEAEVARRAAERLGVEPGSLRDLLVVRRSLDARRKGHPRWLLNVEVDLEGALRGEPAEVTPVAPPEPAPAPVKAPPRPPLVLGAGPAGLFCAWALLQRGVPSVVVDRGRTVSPRRRDVARLMRSGELDPESNMNYGEGGAGAYTDGKLSTRIHHPAVRTVVELFARFGGVSRILSEGKPHVGSDVLPGAISAMREELERGGCTFLWEARAVDLAVREGRVRGLVLADGRTLDCDRLVLAPGNSAREIFELFAARGWPVEAKPFAAGFRVEHPQALVDRIQYGRAAGDPHLPPADYRLAETPARQGGAPRGVFSFCMCPGGVVVPTPTEPEMQCTNGMSNSQRSSPLANAGLVAAVSPEDFAREGFQGPLAGLAWQRKWERAAFRLGGGGYRAPAQRLSDWLSGRPGRAPERSSYRPGLGHADLSTLFPAAVQEALRAAVRAFDRRMRGFVTDEAVLLGVETRTSSPCRLPRGDDFQSPGLRGLYPAGEGAGHAGGIVSSAVDGLRVAEAICRELSA
ncbi:MAG TPA: FAD-dependent oxidoreductase [Anaeromyxobacteraceae bacterium]|nr:FAD-dependent oxidoreductase [Anaeromyxobacteraceae bacterium]